MEANRKNKIELYAKYLEMLCEGNIHSILLHSAGGLGKTYTTIKLLKKMRKKYAYINGVATAVELYKSLYKNRNKILIIDDVETLFADDRIINLLKAALWDVDGKRELAYRTSSNVLEDYPSSFEYTGKIIILANEIRGRYDESHKALFSRCLVYELVYSFEEIIEQSVRIINRDRSLSDANKAFLRDFISKEVKPHHNFNFRLLERLKEFVKYDSNWTKELFFNSIQSDDEVELIISLHNGTLSVADQVKEYTKETGNSKATFFRRKNSLLKKKLIKKKAPKVAAPNSNLEYIA